MVPRLRVDAACGELPDFLGFVATFLIIDAQVTGQSVRQCPHLAHGSTGGRLPRQ
jgi:hypothetical protein